MSVTELPNHINKPGMWSYSCPCLRCKWEAWENENDESVCPMPAERHPDGEYEHFFDDAEFWVAHGHHR